ncbi:MAG: D-aminoacyl-tRNA deacylase [Planctomycetota bacterium]|jgi:D-tyrosyl-tRNA(Tyr) deacylase
MRAVVQRVSQAKVEVDGRCVGEIGGGLLVYVSVCKEDTYKDAEFVAEKLAGLRIFSDDAGKINHSVMDVGGAVLVVSNFTLHGDCRKGRRPGFDAAAEPELAKSLYEKVIELLRSRGVEVAEGEFGGHMHIESLNDGPVTFLVDSKKEF